MDSDTCSLWFLQADLQYYLYAVLVHIGVSSGSGHYYCFIRSTGDSWFKCDDSKVMYLIKCLD